MSQEALKAFWLFYYCIDWREGWLLVFPVAFDNEGFPMPFLGVFDGFGITTKDGTPLLFLYFRIPGETAEYVAGL